MKRSLLFLSGVLFGAWTPGMTPLASPAQIQPATGELGAALDDITRLIQQGRVDTAWERFRPLREKILNAPLAATRGEVLEPSLLEMGRMFLLWENPEAALDVWQVAVQRGSKAAPTMMSEALEKKGWPFWLTPDALKTLRTQTEWLPEEPFRGAKLVESIVSLPAAEDPLYHRKFQYTIAVYLPDLGRPEARPIGGETEQPVLNLSTASYLHQRFLIHFQRPEDHDLAERLARNYAAIYALVFQKLGRQTDFNENGVVHVWLVSEGEAGGEQWKEHLYFYDLERPRSHLEWLREAAHEYGHASLPGSSGFKEPEGWANGELGERLILRWLSTSDAEGGRQRTENGMSAKRLGGAGRAALRSVTLDALNLKESGINAYLSKYVHPLVTGVAMKGWQPALVAKRDGAAMGHVMGLALWAEAAHGTPFLRGMLNRVPDDGTTGLWNGYFRAVAERLRPLTTGQGVRAINLAPLTVAPVAGRLRFFLPMKGRYRLSWVRGRQGAFSLTPGTISTSPGTKGSMIRLNPEQIWNAKSGWYLMDRPVGVLKIERA